MTELSVFWDDLKEDLKDPEFLRGFIIESIRIEAVNSLLNALDDARTTVGLSKAALARAINADPATMRRLFSGGATNPTLETLAEVAAVLGMRVTLEPLLESDRANVTLPLLDGQAVGLDRLILRHS